MKAYEIHFSDRERICEIDCAYTYYIPRVRCPVCRTTWGQSAVEYPALDFDWFSKEELSRKRVVTVEEWRELCGRLTSAAGRHINLLPGGGLGTLSGTSKTHRLQDFAWNSQPIVSKRAVEALGQEGIQLRTGKVDLKCRGRKVETHVSMQVDPVPLLTPENLKELTVEHCSHCGDYNQVKLHPVVPGGLQIDRRKVPAEDLYQSIERFRVIASPRFMDAVKRLQLTGMEFVECGSYV